MTTLRFDSACNICGGLEFRPMATRSDEIPVIACTRCSHGVVEHFPFDLEQLYCDDYFASEAQTHSGYTDYAYTAEHGVAWAAALAGLLRSSGRVLDIGCADGHLLRRLTGPFQRFGIEPNARAAGEARSAGIQIIAADLLDPALQQQHAGTFDLVLAIATFEHIADFRGAFSSALALLKPEGLLVFEVPLITPDLTPDTWFRTSLEHIHYPTERSLQHLIENSLSAKMVGSSVEIRDFAYTYVGIASKSSDALHPVSTDFTRWLTAPPGELAPAEARFRWLLDVIHAGSASPDSVALYSQADPSDWNPMIVRRICELWLTGARRCTDIERYLREVEKARDWHAGETKRRDAILAEFQAREAPTE